MAIAHTKTLLSLDEYAKIMGIPPAPFNSGTTSNVFAAIGSCSNVWWQYSWQNYDNVSREDLAIAISSAESDVTDYLGATPAPDWRTALVDYPRHHRRDAVSYGMMNVRGYPKSIRLPTGMFIAPGKRTALLVGNADVTLSDEDSDGLYETATVTATVSAAGQAILAYLISSLSDTMPDTESSELPWFRVYFSEYGSQDEYEVRPLKSASYDSDTGVYTATMYVWQLIDPDLQERFPGSDALSAVDISDASNIVDDVNIYIVYPNYASAHAQLMWESDVSTCAACGGSGCASCEHTKQDACIGVRDHVSGHVIPRPASFDSDSDSWCYATQSVSRDPDRVRVWYMSGMSDQRYWSGLTHSPMPRQIAEAVAYMATARLERNFCGCGNIVDLSNELRRNAAKSSPDGGFFVLSKEALDNPFGTRVGEIYAWNRVSRLSRKVVMS